MDQVVPDLATASPQETDRCGAVCTMKVAIVHEWFERCAGSERVVEQLIGLPRRRIFTDSWISCPVLSGRSWAGAASKPPLSSVCPLRGRHSAVICR